MAGAKQIASLLSSATEILYAIGAGRRVVAVSHECDYPSDVANKPKATRSLIDSDQTSAAIDAQVRENASSGLALYELDRQVLLRAAPDLIVTQAQCDVCAVRLDDVEKLVQAESALAQTTIVALNPLSLEDVFRDVVRVGAACGCDESARRFADSLKRRVAAVGRITAGLARSDRPRVLCIEWIDPLMPAGNWTPELIEMAGGISGLATPAEHSHYAHWKDVIAFDPEVILIAPCGFDIARGAQEARQLPQRKGWRSLSAVRSGRVYFIDGNAYLNRSGPRLVDTLEILAHLLHPEQAPAPSTSGGPPAWRPFFESAAT